MDKSGVHASGFTRTVHSVDMSRGIPTASQGDRAEYGRVPMRFTYEGSLEC